MVTSGSVDFPGAFLNKMFQIIRIFLQNCLITFILSHKDLETISVATLVMLKLTTKNRSLNMFSLRHSVHSDFMKLLLLHHQQHLTLLFIWSNLYLLNFFFVGVWRFLIT